MKSESQSIGAVRGVGEGYYEQKGYGRTAGADISCAKAVRRLRRAVSKSNRDSDKVLRSV
jgi:hypothetical protein